MTVTKGARTQRDAASTTLMQGKVPAKASARRAAGAKSAARSALTGRSPSSKTMSGKTSVNRRGPQATPARTASEVRLTVDGETVDVAGPRGWIPRLVAALATRLADTPPTVEVSHEWVDLMADMLANAVVGSLAQEGPEEDLGPFYSTTGLTRRLGVSRQALDGRADRHTLLALPGDDGSRLYPLFQFEERGGRLRVIAGLAPVLQALAAAGADPMSTAAWLTAKTDDLDGDTVVEHLRNGGSPEPVLTLVEADRLRWAS